MRYLVSCILYKNGKRRFFDYHDTRYTIHDTRGFTLIELMLVCGIMAVVGAIIFANQNRFGGQVLLQNFAYDVALSVRQAQVYGISVKQFSSSTGFTSAYGAHFDMTQGDTTRYWLFADVVNRNWMYDTNEEVPPSPYLITRGYFISGLRATFSGTESAVNSLDIAFLRPEPDALISANGNSCAANSANCASAGRIILQSPRGDTMSVSVQANGQIAVDQTSTIAP